MAFTLKQLVVPKGKNTPTGGGSSQPELDSDLKPKQERVADPDSLDILAAQPPSPSPDAEYDKLLVSRKNNFDDIFCNSESTNFAMCYNIHVLL